MKIVGWVPSTGSSLTVGQAGTVQAMLDRPWATAKPVKWTGSRFINPPAETHDPVSSRWSQVKRLVPDVLASAWFGV